MRVSCSDAGLRESQVTALRRDLHRRATLVQPRRACSQPCLAGTSGARTLGSRALGLRQADYDAARILGRRARARPCGAGRGADDAVLHARGARLAVAEGRPAGGRDRAARGRGGVRRLRRLTGRRSPRASLRPARTAPRSTTTHAPHSAKHVSAGSARRPARSRSPRAPGSSSTPLKEARA